MAEFAKADIFFVVTTIAVVLVALALIIALIYLIRILRDTNKISSRVRDESGAVLDDVAVVRKKAKKEVVKILESLGNLFTKNKTDAKTKNEKSK